MWDFNDDGIMDIFGQFQCMEFVQGVLVYIGYYEDGYIVFECLFLKYFNNIIFFVLFNGMIMQFYVSNVDYLVIDDLDCDGDLDILIFNLAGGYIELYVNQFIEEGYGCDSFIFELVENCWGGIFENSIEQEVGLVENFGGCFSLQGGLMECYLGSILFIYDVDVDGDKDMLLGDVIYFMFNLFCNGGSCEQAWIMDQEFGFFVNGVMVDVL